MVSDLRRHRKVHDRRAQSLESANFRGSSRPAYSADPQGTDETDPEQTQVYTTASDFWTSRSTRPRRNSMDSLSSSMNSSLHGKATFDPEEQEPAFCDSNSRSSVDFGNSPRGLPPPPVEIGKKHSFECDICGNTIRVDRRLEWQ